MREFRTVRLYSTNGNGKFIQGPEVIQLSCYTRMVTHSDSSPSVVQLTPMSDDFSSFRPWVSFNELSPRLQRLVEEARGPILIDFTFMFDGATFIKLSSILDKDSEVACHVTMEAAIEAALAE